MWVYDMDGVSEFFRGYLPYYLFIVFPIFMLIAPIHGSHEFAVHRMQHFDLHGVAHGKL